MITALTFKKTALFTVRLIWATTLLAFRVTMIFAKLVADMCLGIGRIVFGFRIF